jgi:threonyl-tRNA synthetase
MLVVGQKEAEIRSVAVRHAKKGDLAVQGIDDFITALQAEISERRL